jgi:Putative Holin-like Toxin (Hol-Tox)
MVTVSDTLTLMISFATLIVAVIAVTTKKQPTLLAAGDRLLFCISIYLKPLHFLQNSCYGGIG